MIFWGEDYLEAKIIFDGKIFDVYVKRRGMNSQISFYALAITGMFEKHKCLGRKFNFTIEYDNSVYTFKDSYVLNVESDGEVTILYNKCEEEHKSINITDEYLEAVKYNKISKFWNDVKKDAIISPLFAIKNNLDDYKFGTSSSKLCDDLVWYKNCEIINEYNIKEKK